MPSVNSSLLLRFFKVIHPRCLQTIKHLYNQEAVNKKESIIEDLRNILLFMDGILCLNNIFLFISGIVIVSY
jgi:hypothetical protein